MTFAWAFLSLVSIVTQQTFLDRPPLPAIREVARDPVVLEALWRMFERAHFGVGKLEEAAFVVIAPDGTLSLRRWPASGSPHQSHWNGPLPAHAIAIVHTHPNAMPRPSARDRLTAIETRLMVYVITRSGIVRTNGTDTVTIAKAGWWLARQPRAALAERSTRPATAAHSR